MEGKGDGVICCCCVVVVRRGRIREVDVEKGGEEEDDEDGRLRRSTLVRRPELVRALIVWSVSKGSQLEREDSNVSEMWWGRCILVIIL